MSETTDKTEPRSTEFVRIGPWWTLPAIMAASVALNMLIWWIAMQVGPPTLERFFPLATPGTVILLTAAGAVGAYGVFWVLAQLSPKPAGVFIPFALVALVISLAPDVMLPPEMGGWSEFAVGTLMLMHIAAAVVDVGLLLWIFHRTQPAS